MAQRDIGLVGLGTMGSALALNIADNGFGIAVFNRTTAKTHAFIEEAGDLADRITPTESLEDFVGALSKPRAIILMVPAGEPVDQQMAALRPLLDDDDILIDAGNANYHDTNRRMASDPAFLGVGVSGGEDGARYGPSIMGGGAQDHWDRVAPVLTAIAADHEGEPCAKRMGEGGSGHFVKMVHNGIEYADMQMIAEAYGIMRSGLGMDDAAIGDVFARWNEGVLQSYLIEISAEVARAVDTTSNRPLLDMIVDSAGQKGTGRWTAIEALHIGAAIPVIEAAVGARNLSARLEERAQGQDIFGQAPSGKSDLSLDTLERALICGKIMCYAQGFDMIQKASMEFDWNLQLPEIARVWRAGCIIRSAMLDDMATALSEDPQRTLLFAPFFADHVKETHDALRDTITAAIGCGLAVPALSAGLAYFDTMRTKRGTANMIQGQRDFFGRHGFVRVDGGPGKHGPWAD